MQFNMRIIPLSEDRMILIVQVGDDVITETIALSELTQRVLNYTSVVGLSIAYQGEECEAGGA